jgi:hypothetical protein
MIKKIWEKIKSWFFGIKTNMAKCKKCNHDCHCVMELHSDEYGVCTCEHCDCTIRDEDKTWENEVVYEK